MTYTWVLRPQPDVTAPSCVSVSLDISHVNAGHRPDWLAPKDQETVTSTSHTVKDDGNPEKGSQLKQHLSSLTSSQLEGIGRVLLIPESTYQEFDNGHHSEETYRQELAEQCALRINGARHQVPPVQTPGQTPGQTNPTSSAWHSGGQSPPEPTKTDMTQLQRRPANPHDSKRKESNGLGCAYGEGQASRDGTLAHTTGPYGAGARPKQRSGIHRPPESAPPPTGSTHTLPAMPEHSISWSLPSATTSLPQENHDHSPEDGMDSYFREYQDQSQNENRGTQPFAGYGQNSSTMNGTGVQRPRRSSSTVAPLAASTIETPLSGQRRPQATSAGMRNGTDVILKVNGHTGQRFNNGQSNGRYQENAKKAQNTDTKNRKWPTTRINGFVNPRPSLNGDLANRCDHTNPKIVDEGFETDDEDDNTEVKRPFDSGKRPVDSEKRDLLQEDDEEDEQLNSSFLSVQNASCPSSYGSWDADCLSVLNPSVSY